MSGGVKQSKFLSTAQKLLKKRDATVSPTPNQEIKEELKYVGPLILESPKEISREEKGKQTSDTEFNDLIKRYQMLAKCRGKSIEEIFNDSMEMFEIGEKANKLFKSAETTMKFTESLKTNELSLFNLASFVILRYHSDGSGLMSIDNFEYNRGVDLYDYLHKNFTHIVSKEKLVKIQKAEENICSAVYLGYVLHSFDSFKDARLTFFTFLVMGFFYPLVQKIIEEQEEMVRKQSSNHYNAKDYMLIFEKRTRNYHSGELGRRILRMLNACLLKPDDKELHMFYSIPFSELVRFFSLELAIENEFGKDHERKIQLMVALILIFQMCYGNKFSIEVKCNPKQFAIGLFFQIFKEYIKTETEITKALTRDLDLYFDQIFNGKGQADQSRIPTDLEMDLELISSLINDKFIHEFGEAKDLSVIKRTLERFFRQFVQDSIDVISDQNLDFTLAKVIKEKLCSLCKEAKFDPKAEEKLQTGVHLFVAYCVSIYKPEFPLQDRLTILHKIQIFLK